MKKLIIALAFVLLLVPVCFSHPQEPNILIYADRPIYGAGESGVLLIQFNTYGIMREAEFEVVIISPENIIIDGVIMHTEIPEKIVVNKDNWQTEQIILKEGLEYLAEEKTIFRTIPFIIPEGAPTGDYEVRVRATYIGGVVEELGILPIVGQGVVDSILVIFVIVIFIVILAIINREFYLGKEKRRKTKR